MRFRGWYGLAGLTDNEQKDAQRAALDAKAAVAELSERLDHVSLLLQAVWTLARDKLGATDEELAQRVQDLDLSDGQLDGKVRHAAEPCPNCRRLISANRIRCLYCGEKRGDTSLFDAPQKSR